MFIKKTIFSILNYIKDEDDQLKINNSIKTKVLQHFKKSHILIIIFFYISFFFINLYTILFYFKPIFKLNKTNQKKIFSKLKKLIKFKQEIVIELFHALLTLHNEINETPLRNKINKQNLSQNTYFDNIIIGSGPGASITAYKLQKENRDTLVIEKGDFLEVFKLKHPGEEFIHKWKHGGLSGSLGSQVKYASGECFGGGSEINSGLYHKPDKKFIKKLREKFKIKNFNYEDINQEEKNIKKLVDVCQVNFRSDPISNILIKTAKKKKINYEIMPRLLKLKKNVVKKSTMTNTLLKKYLLLKGKISLNTTATKIVKKNNLWVIKVNKNNKVLYLNCKNLFICAGAPNTLFLLKKNKLVNKKVSKFYFHFHPMIKVIAKYKKKINSHKYDICPTQINHFFPKFIIGHATSSKAQLKINSLSNNEVYSDVKNNWKHMAIFHATFSLGYGKLIRIPKIEYPIINYKLSNKDLDELKSGLKKFSKFLFSSNCEYIFPVLANSRIIKNKNHNFVDKIKNINELNLSTVHLLGGCPMGENQNITVTDSFGKVHGQNNLYVNDGSLICAKLIKNPQGIIMTIALRNIKNFLKNIPKQHIQ